VSQVPLDSAMQMMIKTWGLRKFAVIGFHDC
jgi:hypothetical protein